MSTALVASTTIAPATAKVSSTRVGNATSFTYVDPLENSLGARPGDQSVRYDERWSDFDGAPKQSPNDDRSVRFGGILVSREVGATIMMAQAQSSLPKANSIPEAEKQIRIYEFNQSLAGTPETATGVGLSRF